MQSEHTHPITDSSHVSSAVTRRLLRAILRTGRASIDLVGILVCTLVLGSLALYRVDGFSGELGWARLLLGLVVVLVFPGYLVGCILFPLKADIDGAERAAIAVGVSVAIIPVLSLWLNWSPFGLSRMSVLVSEVMIVVVGVIGVFARRLYIRDIFGVYMYSNQLKHMGAELFANANRRLLFAAISGASISTLLAVGGIAFAPESAFTEFYLLGEDGYADEYPRETEAGKPMSVVVGITNHEAQPTEYFVSIQSGGREIGIGPIADRVVFLRPGETWEQPTEFVMSNLGDEQSVEFVLQRQPDQREYRRLRLWLDVK